MELLIKNGWVYTGSSLFVADVLVRDGRVAGLGESLLAPGAAVFDAAGCVVSPGFCDLHVHLREPGFIEKETIATGTAAAAAGGFTTVCAMPNLAPVPDNAQTLAPQLAAIQKDAAVQVLPYGAITAGQEGCRLAEIDALAPFVCGLSDDGRGVQSEEMMRAAMQAAAKAGLPIVAHCEDESKIPAGAVTVQENSAFAAAHGFTGVSNESEWAEVERDIRLARETGARLHICHASTAQTFALVRAAKADGLPVSCEVTPHNLLLCCDDIAEDDGRFKMNPPLRTAADRDAAVAALLDGTIDAVATDHAPHTLQQKSGGFAHALNGVVGLETAFAAMYTGFVLPGILPLERLLQLFTALPRAVIGAVQPPLAVGAPASLTVLDITHSRPVDPAQFCSKGRATPFAGKTLTGWPVLTLYEGRVVFGRENNQPAPPVYPAAAQPAPQQTAYPQQPYPPQWQAPYGQQPYMPPVYPQQGYPVQGQPASQSYVPLVYTCAAVPLVYTAPSAPLADPKKIERQANFALGLALVGVVLLLVHLATYLPAVVSIFSSLAGEILVQGLRGLCTPCFAASLVLGFTLLKTRRCRGRVIASIVISGLFWVALILLIILGVGLSFSAFIWLANYGG